jgi:hypothetical protein
VRAAVLPAKFETKEVGLKHTAVSTRSKGFLPQANHLCLCNSVSFFDLEGAVLFEELSMVGEGEEGVGEVCGIRVPDFNGLAVLRIKAGS